MPRSQQDRSRATRAVLLAAGRELFAEHGYAGVSADDLVARAGLTRGALHHHFGDKSGLFRAVFEQLETELTEELRTVLTGRADVLARMLAGLRAFLDLCQRPEVLRIGLADAPSVLGWQTWRAIEAEHGLGLIVELLREGVAAGTLVVADVEVFGRLVLSAVIEAALLIAAEPARRPAAEQTLLALLTAALPR